VDRKQLAAGLWVLLTAGASAAVLAVPRFITLDNYSHETIYDGSRWVLVAMLAVGGAVVATATGAARSSAAAVSFVITLQLAGSGVVARKHWLPYYGSGGGPPRHIAVLYGLAIVLAVVNAVAAVICWLTLRPAAAPWPRASSYMALGVATSVVLPYLFGRGSSDNLDLTSLVGYAALASVPFGLSFITAGLVRREVAASLLAAVCLSSLIDARAAAPMTFGFTNPDRPFLLVAAVAGCLAALETARRALQILQGPSSAERRGEGAISQ